MPTGFSFEVINAGDYDSLRPGYAPQAAAWVARRGRLGDGSLIVDLAAGTGQLSRLFAAPGVRLAAVEPARNMRAAFIGRLPGLPIVAGCAEAMPLRTGAADAVVVGNAFHHFDAGRAVAEIRRVLRAGGVLALLWARTSSDVYDSYPQLRAVDKAVERARAAGPAAASLVSAMANWTNPSRRIQGFTPFEKATFPMMQAIQSARLADLYATSSDVASLPATVRADLLARIREICRGLPEMLELPRFSMVHLCFRETGGDRGHGGWPGRGDRGSRAGGGNPGRAAPPFRDTSLDRDAPAQAVMHNDPERLPHAGTLPRGPLVPGRRRRAVWRGTMSAAGQKAPQPSR